MEVKKAEENAVSSFVEYLQSAVNLDTLDNMTKKLDKELTDSQLMLSNIKTMFDSFPIQTVQSTDNGLRHEDLSKFLEASVPKLLLPDMTGTSSCGNLDRIVTSMRGYTEQIKKNIVFSPPRPQGSGEEMKSLELEQYALSLDKLNNELSSIKLRKQDEGSCRDPQLEEKLEQLCKDVDVFTQVVQTKTKLSECNKNWTESQVNGSALQYDGIINKLLAGINEVMYLLKNKN